MRRTEIMITLGQIQKLNSLRDGMLPISSLYVHLWPDRGKKMNKKVN